jgi:hypothetical protein
LKTIVVAVFIGIVIHFGASSQIHSYTPLNDTLTFHFTTGGNIDTFDLPYTFPITSVPGGSLGRYNAVPTVDFYRRSAELQLNSLPKLDQNWIVSALPHIGFFYSFGTKGTQFLHADYQQTFLNKSLLNIDINRSSSQGFGRNSDFANQDFKLAYRFGKNKFNGAIRGIYEQNTTTLNGGVSNDTTWLEQGIAFAPIRKENTNSLQRFFNSEATFKLNFLSDSTKLRAGIISKHNFSLWNRVYNEIEDTLLNIYPVTNINNDTTRDQFQDAKLKNSIGIFAESKKFHIALYGSHRYWRFQNLGNNIDQNETSTDINFGFHQKRIWANSENYLNLTGASNEFYSKNNFKLGGRSKYVSIGFNTESMLPQLIQRQYFGNNIYYSTQLNKQNRNDIYLSGAYPIWKLDVVFTVGTLAWKNNLIWENYAWQIGNQSNQTVNYFKAKFHLDLNWFQAYPEFQIQNGSDYLPQTVISGRFLVKKKLFAAKKLQISFAVDPQLSDSYTLMSYNTLLDNWYFDSNSNRVGGQKLSLHSTFTVHIEEFKFFIRTENLQSFWSNVNTEIALNYYRPTFLLRLGISWDFFN